MYPILLIWGPITIKTKGVCILIGALIALWYLARSIKVQKYNSIHLFTDNVFFLFFVTFIASRIAGIIENFNRYFFNFSQNIVLQITISLWILITGILIILYYILCKKPNSKLSKSLKKPYLKLFTSFLLNKLYLILIIPFLLLIISFYFLFPQQLQIFYIWDNVFSFHIGFTVFFLALYYICMKNKVDFWKTFDLLPFPLLIVLIFSSFGDLSTGTNYGVPPESDIWPTISFDSPEVRFAIPVHPVQIYSIIIYIFVFIAGKIFAQKKHIPGVVALFTFLLYFIFEALLEFIRGEPVKIFWENYRISQMYDVIIVLTIIIIFVLQTHKKDYFRKVSIK